MSGNQLCTVLKDLSLNGDRPLTGQYSLLDHIETST